MPRMTKKQLGEFLNGAHVAKLSVVRADGSPFVAPVYYQWDGTVFYIVGRKKASWAENIRREPRVTLLIDEPKYPYPRVTIQGKAKVVGTELSDWVKIGEKQVKRYFGSQAGISYFEGSMDQPRLTIEITPTKITSWISPPESVLKEKPMLDWHPKYYEPGTKWYAQYETMRKTTR